MSESEIHSVLLVAVIAVVTMLLRFLPFLIFGGGKKTPEYITYLSTVLPCAIMGMLVIYCFRSVDFLSSSHGIPELIAAAVVVGLHLWKKNTLLSIIAGTAVYMIFVQLIFV